MALYLGNKLVAGGSTGLEIGDIGFAPFGIDEVQNKRRYLNGQVISQVQFVSFTNKVKERAKLYPNIITTEGNWQAEVTNSKLGQCGKFVIDDTLGTIRLPKVVNIQGLTDLALMGSTIEAGLPNITGSVDIRSGWGVANETKTGCFNSSTSSGKDEKTSAADGTKLTFNASDSNPIYGNSNTVQQEAVQYPYFIQVATGTEESVDVTREIELNNPFSLLDYKWSEYELNNASWLLSNGQFNSGATYISVYNLLLEIYNGTETKDGVNVKLSTEEYTDTDFVINTDETTFRLPVKVKLASGNAVVGNGMTLGLTNGTDSYGMTASADLSGNSTYYGSNVSTSSTSGANAAGILGVTPDPEYSGIETSSSGLKLYFYVGETIQDANLISASGVFTALSNKVGFDDKETVVGWGMPDYNNGVAINIPFESTNTTWEAQSNGYLSILVSGPYMNPYVLKANGNKIWQSGDDINSNTKWAGAIIPVKKGVQLNYSSDTESTFETIATTFYAV